MQMDDMILVSIDDHMVEPPDMFDNHVPEKYRDLVPKVVRNDAGVDEWEFQGQKTSTPFGMAATVGWPKDEWGFNPGSYSELRPGCFDVHERVRDMDANGVLGSMNFPTMAGLQRPHLHRGRRQGGRARRAARLQRLGDRRVVRQLPGPLHPAGHHPDVGRRPGRRGDPPGRQEGLPVDQLPRDPARAGLPELPLRSLGPDDDGALRRGHGAVAAHRRRLRGDPPPTGGADRPPHGAGLPDQRHHRAGPALRADAAAVPRPEGGAVGGRDRVDPLLLRPDRSPLPEPDAGCTAATTSAASCPSEVFRDHILACYITDPSGLLLRDRIGIDIIAWECDYPHTDTTWPESPEHAWGELQGAGCSDEEIHKITWENACRFFDWDPFEHTDARGRHRRRAPGPCPRRRRRRHPHVAGGVEGAERGRRDRRLAKRIVRLPRELGGDLRPVRGRS